MMTAMPMMLVVSLSLILGTCAAAPMVPEDGVNDLLHSMPDTTHPGADLGAIQQFMELMWLEQKQHPHGGQPSKIISIPPAAVQEMRGEYIILFSDADLSWPFDSAQLLFHGDHCVDRVHVKACPGASAHCRAHGMKTSSALRLRLPGYYVSELRDTFGPVLTDGEASNNVVPSLQVILHVGVPSCRLIALLLVQHPLPEPQGLMSTIGHGRMKRFAPAAPPATKRSFARRDDGSSLPPPSSVSQCRKQAWTVRTSDIGVNNIIQPQVLTINKCVGKCTLNATTLSTNAQLRHLYNLNHDTNLAPVSCCVPIDVAPVVVVLVNKHGNMVLETLGDAVATACGCL